MGLLDSLVETNFRDDPVGRVVVVPGGRQHRGYLVKSAGDERKLRAFFKIFYLAQFSILFLAYCVVSEAAREISGAIGKPSLWSLTGFVLLIYVVVAGVPYVLLWKTYKKALFSFVEPGDEVGVTSKSRWKKQWIVVVGVSALILAIVTPLIIYLPRPK